MTDPIFLDRLDRDHWPLIRRRRVDLRALLTPQGQRVVHNEGSGEANDDRHRAPSRHDPSPMVDPEQSRAHETEAVSDLGNGHVGCPGFIA